LRDKTMRDNRKQKNSHPRPNLQSKMRAADLVLSLALLGQGTSAVTPEEWKSRSIYQVRASRSSST